MARLGGARPGAGRKKGIPNKRTREVLEKAAKGGLLPLDYMLQQVRNTRLDRAIRMQAARDAAPYVHPRLQTTNVGGIPGAPVIFQMINRPPKEKR